MEFYINPSSVRTAFSLPSVIADKCLKLATGDDLKIILYVFRHSGDGINIKECSDNLGISETEVEDSLIFWTNNGVLETDNIVTKSETPKTKAVEKNEKPSRVDVAKRGLEDENIAFILREAQMKFGRNLKTNEASTLLYLYDDLGLNVSVVLFLLQYCLNQNKLNIRFIEKTAVCWANSGVSSVAEAEKIISDEIKADLSWKRIERLFGIEHRKPSTKELNYAVLWFEEMNLTEEYLNFAYDVCVDAKGKFSFSYCAKVIENWQKAGFDTLEKVKANQSGKLNENSKYSFAGYDISAYEKMLNEKDRGEDDE